MPHDFTAAIETAFADYEVARAGKVALPSPRFEFGPYAPPAVAIGQTVECARYGEVRVAGWSEGPLRWPQCRNRGPRALILFEDLARAVEVESARTVALAWGVSRASVWKWRAVLQVPRANAGTAQRLAANVPAVIPRERNALGLKRAHSLAARARAEANKGGETRQAWTPALVEMMGVLSDAAIAASAGCNAQTVGRERRRRGIASIGHSGVLPDLQPLDGALIRARRLELGLTQAQIGARCGCNARRISHLESAHKGGREGGVIQSTIDKLARALECAPDDLTP